MYKEVIFIHNVNIISLIRDLFNGSIKRRREALTAEAAERRQLIDDLDLIAERLDRIQKSYDLICESELIDAAIYEELALKAQYAYLLRLAKEKNIKCRMVIH
ncbi:MAG: YaaL family protein [Oscillospiraceae bacterium]|nr:YaaL family protein [Oscillospiraceae bacterium]